MWPKLKFRNDLIECNGFFFDPENPFARFKGGADVEQAPTHTKTWGQLETTLANLVAPPIYNQKGKITGRELAQPEYYGGQRLAEISPDAMLAAQNALGGLAGGPMSFYDPIYQRAEQEWEQEIAPSVMERFAGMGNAMGGGAASALAREGQNLITGISAEVAPLFQNAIFQGLPALSGFEQAGRQAPLDIEREKWFEQQPYNSPYVALGKDIMSGGGANAIENYAEPDTDWGQVGGSLAGNAMLASAMKSDKRLKKNLEPIRDALKKLQEISGYTFEFKKDDEPGRRAGVMAQDVRKVLPEAVEEKSGVLYVRLDGVIGLLVNAVNELAEQVAAPN